MAIKVYNPNKIAVTAYSGDGDSVEVESMQTLPIDNKFKPRLPKTLKLKDQVGADFKVFLPKDYVAKPVYTPTFYVLGLI